MTFLFKARSGFTLIEVVAVIIVIGILAAFATRTFVQTIETARYEATYEEMDGLIRAMVGNSDIYSDGIRSDFGYVGDIGALPFNLEALASNPGGYKTWDGPYIVGDFSSLGFCNDAWGSRYIYSDTLLRSIGAGVIIDKRIVGDLSQILENAVRGIVFDASNERPGSVFKDSLVLALSYPNGAGAITNVEVNPTGSGRFDFPGIPIGNHLLTAVYLPDSDTVFYPVTILPGRDAHIEIRFPADLW